MTVLGKTLAVLNLVLSLVVAAFIIMTYVARTNWHKAYVDEAARTQAAQANADTYRAETEKLQGDVKAVEAKVAPLTAQLAQSQKNAVDAQKAADDRLQKEMENSKKLTTEKEAMIAEKQRRQQEVDNMRDALAKRETQIAGLNKQVQDATDDKVQAQIDLRSEQARNDRLNRQLEVMSEDLRKAEQRSKTVLASTGAGGAERRNPPTEDVEGQILKTDASGYLTLSIGSDAGLSKGNTLEVYRLKPDPKYLGTIEILRVRPDEAVARPVGRPNGVIQVGDRVSKDVMSNKR
jgi:hypothetical protein